MISINPDNPQPRLIAQIVEQLKMGAVICYPTDTVYGIGCDIFNQKAVKRIYQLKNRPQQKPFSFMCESLKNVSTYCHVSNTAYRLMKKHLPGPYTFILPTMKIVPKIMTSKQKTVGIRVPENNICRMLTEALGNPILTTSASLGDVDALTDPYDMNEAFCGRVDEVIDGGAVYPVPSTIVSLVTDFPEIIREGKGSTDAFR